MDGSANFNRYVRGILRRWWLPVLLAGIALGGVYYRLGDASPRYTASTVLMVTASPIVSPVGGTPGVAEPFRMTSESTLTYIQEIFRTRAMAERVARRLRVADVQGIQQSIAASARGRSSNLVQIQATATTPGQAQGIANAAAQELIGFFRETNAHDAREARLFIGRELARVRAQLEAADRRLLAVRRDPRATEGAPSAMASAYFTAVGSLDDERLALRATEQRLAAAAARLSAEAPTLVSETARADNPVFRLIQSRLTEREIERLQLSGRYTPQHPRMQQLEVEIRELRNRLATEPILDVNREVRASNPVHARLLMDIVTLQVDRAATQARIAALEGIVRQRRGALAGLSTTQARVAQLVREHEVLETNHRLLSERYQDALLRENVAAFTPAGVQVIEPAFRPEPIPATLPRTAAAAGAIGLLLGVMLAALLEASDGAMRSREEIERALGMPVLAEIPDAAAPRVAPANAIFATGLILVLGASLLGAFVRTPFAPVNAAGRAMRITVIDPVHDGAQWMRGWVRSTMGAVVQSSTVRVER